tara:strand:- start:205 stop:1590 length:1386 start_codon:yes stop_codon:yes gene_type:complete
MEKRNLLVLFSVIFLLGMFIIPLVNSCGCGMAISDFKVFNSLKETQAYLMIDIKDKNTYNEMPFFRMISMDEPHNVTIVFPIDGIPYDVEGKTMPAKKFLKDYKINIAENYFIEQSFSGLIKKINRDFKDISPKIFLWSNGFFVSVINPYYGASYGRYESVGLNPITSFKFEGGSLDIYDVNSMDTLEEFVKTINITLTGKVEELVTKYKDYYVAVLYLKVPSALDEDLRNQLKLCPEQTERVKQELQEKIGLEYKEIKKLVQGPCSEPLRKLINSAINIDPDLNGTLVNMKFQGTNQFFYPTSIVNSYKYPITDQRYFIKTPSNLHISLDSSEIHQTANFDSERWYRVNSTEEDIKGKIINANTDIRFKDKLRSINQMFYNNSQWFVFIFYLIIIILPFLYYHFKVKESLTGREIGLTIGLFLIGGLLLTSLAMAIKKKKKFALIIFLLWLILLAIMIIF